MLVDFAFKILLLSHLCVKHWIIYTKGIHGWVLIDTRQQYLPSMLDRYLIDTSSTPRLRLPQYLG